MNEDPALWQVQWDRVNLRHARRHGLNPAIAKAVLHGGAKVFENEAESGRLIVIGPERRGHFWTISFEQVRSGRWRVITGWPSKPSEIRLFRGETNG